MGTKNVPVSTGAFSMRRSPCSKLSWRQRPVRLSDGRARRIFRAYFNLFACLDLAAEIEDNFVANRKAGADRDDVAVIAGQRDISKCYTARPAVNDSDLWTAGPIQHGSRRNLDRGTLV